MKIYLDNYHLKMRDLTFLRLTILNIYRYMHRYYLGELHLIPIVNIYESGDVIYIHDQDKRLKQYSAAAACSSIGIIPVIFELIWDRSMQFYILH